jgi:hypothetical protein
MSFEKAMRAAWLHLAIGLDQGQQNLHSEYTTLDQTHTHVHIDHEGRDTPHVGVLH